VRSDLVSRGQRLAVADVGRAELGKNLFSRLLTPVETVLLVAPDVVHDVGHGAPEEVADLAIQRNGVYGVRKRLCPIADGAPLSRGARPGSREPSPRSMRGLSQGIESPRPLERKAVLETFPRRTIGGRRASSSRCSMDGGRRGRRAVAARGPPHSYPSRSR